MKFVHEFEAGDEQGCSALNGKIPDNTTESIKALRLNISILLMKKKGKVTKYKKFIRNITKICISISHFSQPNGTVAVELEVVVFSGRNGHLKF